MLARDLVYRSGYDLFDFGTYWELRFNHGIFRGSLKQVCIYAVQQHDFDMYELELGVMEMEKDFCDAATFGIFKRFMFPFDSSENKVS